MTNFEKIVEAIELKLEEVGKDNIDYGAHIDDRFCYDCQAVIESKHHHIDFTFEAYDWGTGFKVENIHFNSGFALPNLTERLTNYKFRAYGK